MARWNILSWVAWANARRLVLGLGLTIFLGWIWLDSIHESGAAPIWPRLFVTVVLGAAVLLTIDALTRITNPARHPAIRVMLRYGAAREVAGALNAELATARPVGDRFLITPHWLVYHTRITLKLVRCEDLVWAFRRKKAGSFSDGSELVLCSAAGDTDVISVDGFEIDKVLAALARQAPWAFYNFAEELDAMWKSDRRQLLALVAERRASQTAHATR